MMKSIRKDIFLSHSHEDKVFVRQLAERLEKKGFSCWIDEAEIGIGDSIIKKIGEGVYESNFVAAIISKNSVKSPWVQKELQMAMTREISGQRICVLPMIIDECTALLPYYLRDKLYADFRKKGTYQKALGSLVRSIKKTSDLHYHESAAVGDVDIGKIIHDRGDEFYGFRSTKFMERTAILSASFGIFCLIVPIFLQKAGLIQTSKIMAIAGGSLMLAGLLKILSSYLLRTSFDRDRRILIEWERIGDPGVFLCFSHKWRERYQAGKLVSVHRAGMKIQAITMLLEIISVVALGTIFIKLLWQGTLH